MRHNGAAAARQRCGGGWEALLLVSVADAADMAFLGALFGALERDFVIGPTELGWLSFVQAVAIKFTTAFWGPVVDARSEPDGLIQMTLFGIGLFSAATGMAQTYGQLLACRFFAGAASALVRPLSGYIIGRWFPHSTRGKQFGLFKTSQTVGRMTGTFLGAYFASSWRWLLLSFGAVCCLLALLMPLLCTRPGSGYLSFGTTEKQYPDESADRLRAEDVNVGHHRQGEKASRAALVAVVFRSRSFQLLLLHGVFGSFPYSGFGFVVLWFQTGGVASQLAGAYANCLHLGTLFGNICAGYLGDYAASKSASHGRIYIAQIGDVLRIPMTCFIFGLSLSNSTAAVALFALGMVIPLVGSGATLPMITELAPPEVVGTISGYHMALESVFAVLAGPMVGVLAEQLFGYDLAALRHCVDDPAATGFACPGAENNHAALSKALLWNAAGPWTVCALIVSSLHYFFPRDRLRALAAASSAQRVV
eukprot:CAMPEP_0202101928 /NCGR_PEP_ID=MMETSP0965-20130614/4011_1 /ASSEMBLY_ACC=CAM_ASM_000507 /TAXON_ID=4773 /ORGANISM="Schizochytrium aggregatum, Strain ATCC28209" /LENGTH=478 /DNA_ID=CAMNT_0048670663 /DNA_START=13 /DNA_END=1449 /DNA_ORIENTATION=-